MKMAHDRSKAPGRRGRTVLDAFLEDFTSFQLAVEPHERPREVQVPLREVRLEFHDSTGVVGGALPPS